MNGFQELASFLRGNADLLRGVHRPRQFGRVPLHRAPAPRRRAGADDGGGAPRGGRHPGGLHRREPRPPPRQGRGAQLPRHQRLHLPAAARRPRPPRGEPPGPHPRVLVRGPAGLHRALREERAFAALGEAEQARALGTLNLLATKGFPRRAAFERVVDEAFAATKVPLPAQVRKTVLSSLSERDEGAEVCTDGRGKPEPDPDRSDTENVPLQEDVRRYLEREALPHVPGAWVSQRVGDPKDGQVGKAGYEINFNRSFYRYTPPRPLEAIEGEIRELEERVVERLRRVAT